MKERIQKLIFQHLIDKTSFEKNNQLVTAFSQIQKPTQEFIIFPKEWPNQSII